MSSHELRVLRAALFRISASSPHDLPAVIPRIACDLQDCKSLLTSASGSAKDSASAVQVHKLRTQINTFLSAKTPEARWSGTILTKAVIELGGLDAISKCGPWARFLLQNLNKPDPASSKKLVVITLTRIFDLTGEHQSLARELTTPLLKDFIPACLNIVSPKSSSSVSTPQEPSRHALLSAVLESFAHLLPSHPSIFRPHVSQLRKLLLPLVAPVLDLSVQPKTQEAARRLFVLLPFSAPKSNTASPAKEASDVIKSILSTIHATTTFLFRSIREDWSPMPGADMPHVNVPTDLELSSANYKDALELPPWHGVHDGSARLHGLLDLLSVVFLSPTPDQISIPLAHIVDLIVRLCSMTVPSEVSQGKRQTETLKSSVHANDQISQTERDALLTELPHIHTTAMQLISALCTRLGSTLRPVHEILLDQIVWIFPRESFSEELRLACYTALGHVLESSGCGFTKPVIQQIIPLIELCCEDLLASANSQHDKTDALTNGLSTTLDAGNKTTTSSATSSSSDPTPLRVSASHLLTTAFISIQPSYLPSRVRAKLDRTAILTQNKDAMLASVLNPPVSTAGSNAAPTSILPFLARAAPADLATEALLRPRLPAVRPVEAEAPEDVESDAGEDILMELRDRDGLRADEVEDSAPAVASKTDQVAPDSAPLASPSQGEAAKTRSSATLSATPGLKRRPEMTPEQMNTTLEEPEQKRARLLTDAETVLSEPSKAETQDDARTFGAGRLDTTSEATGSRTVPSRAAGENKVLTTTKPPSVSAPSAGPSTTLGGPADSDDDSDFSIPEINMDPDTEDEEDEEDDELGDDGSA